MVRSESTEGVVGFRQKTLLNPSMAETMEGIQGLVQTHLPEPCAEPDIILVAKNCGETTETVGYFENRGSSAAVRFSVDVYQV